MQYKRLLIAFIVTIALGSGTAALANHSWGGYHWARTSNPLTLKVGDNVTAAWDSTLATTVSDWSASDIVDMTIVPGATKSVKRCTPTAGRDEVCNAAYGKNGWLGVAQVWVNGLHITQGTVKLNDSYFATAAYNTPAWRNLVSCQEVGHTLGLDHQDENFNNANLGTCMDYTNDPSTNQHPNQHDYDELDTIYAHLDSTTTVGQTTVTRGANLDGQTPREWGREISRSADGRVSEYVRDLGLGQKILTHVIWAE
jgi:hypothetical protein